MAFVNEYIPEAAYEKYNLRSVCGEHNLKALRGHMHSRTWTIDREGNSFLIKVWAHHESDFSGWAFYWDSEWIFFEMRPVKAQGDRANSSCMYEFLVKELKFPNALESRHDDAICDLRSAITALPGGVDFDYAIRNVIIEFAEE